MTTPISTASIPAAGSQDRDASRLDRRRGKATAAKDAADSARAAVVQVEVRLAANATRAQQDRAALQQAHDQVARLRKSLKATVKLDAALVTQRRKATAAAAKAAARAQTAETRYGRAVLAELVRREKDRDRAAAKTVPSAPAAPAAATGSAPAAERPTRGTATATRTAARKTATPAARTGRAAGGTRHS